MTGLEAATLGIAVLGAGLGIINTLRDINRDRVKLSIRPTFGYPIFNNRISDDPFLGVEVINRSTFPITVQEVGFEIAGSTKRAVITNPITMDRSRLPRRMEPRTTTSFYAEPAMWRAKDFDAYTRPFVRTAENETYRGSRRNFTQFKKSARK